MHVYKRDGTEECTEGATAQDVAKAMSDPNVGKIVLSMPGETVRRWNGVRYVTYRVDDAGKLVPA